MCVKGGRASGAVATAAASSLPSRNRSAWRNQSLCRPAPCRKALGLATNEKRAGKEGAEQARMYLGEPACHAQSSTRGSEGQGSAAWGRGAGGSCRA